MHTRPKKKNDQKERRRGRVRAKVSGTSIRPRLVVFRSNAHTYAQLIDDTTGITVASADSRAVKGSTETERAKAVGQELAKMAIEKKVKGVVFDRAGYIYTGRVRAVADGAREGGLTL